MIRYLKFLILLFATASLSLGDPPAVTPSSTSPTAADVAARQPLPWAIPSCEGGFDWRDSSLGGTGGLRIVQWNDKSGKGRHLTYGTDTDRHQWTTTGATGRGGVYNVGGGGITGLSSQSFTAIWIGRDFGPENPASGLTSTNGSVYLPSSGPRMRWDSCYGQAFGAGAFAPGCVFPPNNAPAIYAQVFSATEVVTITSGMRSSKAALGAATFSITKVFGQHDATAPPLNYGAFFRPTQGVYFYSRALSLAEIASVANYYGASMTPPRTILYCFGSSTPAGQNSGSFQDGCIQLFADSIGASRCTWSVGGSGWNEHAGTLAAAGAFNVHRGAQAIHVILPASNNLAANVAVATCQTAITDHITRIRSVDPLAWIILCPVAPRNASFTGGQTYDDFDVDRLALNSFMEATATATVGIVYANYMTIPGMGTKGDEANTTFFDPDRIHYTLFSHREIMKSLHKGWQQLHQGASVEKADNVVPFHRADPRTIIFGDFGKQRKAA